MELRDKFSVTLDAFDAIRAGINALTLINLAGDHKEYNSFISEEERINAIDWVYANLAEACEDFSKVVLTAAE